MCEHVFVVNMMHMNIILEMEAKLIRVRREDMTVNQAVLAKKKDVT